MDAALIERLTTCSSLPSIPAVALQIIEAVRTQLSDAKAVTELIKQDPAIAAKLVAHANSACYGQRRTYKTIHEAVILLGTRKALHIALTLTLVNAFERQKDRRMDYARYWKRSLLAGAYAQAVATHLDQVNADETFLAALLQDIGMLAIEQLESTLYATLDETPDYHTAARAAEGARLGVDHAVIGCWLLEQWGLPALITHAVERSHYPFGFTIRSPFTTFDKCIVLSGLIADIWLNDDWIVYLNRALFFARRWLDLCKQDIVLILGAQGPNVSEFESLFNIELLNPKETEEILAAASGLLSAHTG